MKLTPILVALLVILAAGVLFWFFPVKRTELIRADPVVSHQFSKRLLAVCNREEGLVRKLLEIMPSTVGLSADLLDAEKQALLRSLVEEQKSIRQAFETFQHDFSEHLTKYPNEKSKVVLLEIQQSEVSANLGSIENDMAKNSTSRAANAASFWAAQLRQWVGQLEEAERTDQEKNDD